jgi:hypothetical protein
MKLGGSLPYPKLARSGYFHPTLFISKIHINFPVHLPQQLSYMQNSE